MPKALVTLCYVAFKIKASTTIRKNEEQTAGEDDQATDAERCQGVTLAMTILKETMEAKPPTTMMATTAVAPWVAHT